MAREECTIEVLSISPMQDNLDHREIFLCGKQLREFPTELFNYADSLELLDLSHNELSELPESFAKFKNLKILFLTGNKFRSLPKVLSKCANLFLVSFKSNGMEDVSDDCLPENLKWLILTDNRISRLPASIGKLKELRKVALAGNSLTSLPSEMSNCRNIELLRISCNQFAELSDWILRLPRLAWLGFAGNPLCNSQNGSSDFINEIDASEVEFSEQIGKGQGGSGQIFKAFWVSAAGAKNVAIKTFKGNIIADGSPLDEMRAWARAGAHPNLPLLHGRLINHANFHNALVFDFIPPKFRNLAGVPSFTSCTRDVYSDGTTFDPDFALAVCKGVTKAALHLHAHGVLHGDLYAHNTMVTDVGETLVGDLGAASLMKPENSPYAKQLERIEVRAFGYLVEELASRCSSRSALELGELATLCLIDKIGERPTFRKIVEML